MTAPKSVINRKLPTANRSAVTNDPLGNRANARTPRGRRIRDLFKGYLVRVGTDADVVTQSHCLRVAELVVIAEDLRARSAEELRPDMINAITRIESTAARAERALFKDAPDAKSAKEDSELNELLAKYRGPAPRHEDYPDE